MYELERNKKVNLQCEVGMCMYVWMEAQGRFNSHYYRTTLPALIEAREICTSRDCTFPINIEFDMK